MDDLLLPGTIPGLLRLCSPVRRRNHGDLALQESSCILRIGPDARYDIGAPGVLAWIPGALLALDLTDATGRAHAVWWWRVTLHPDLQWRANPEWGGGYSLEGLRQFASDGQYRDLLADLNPDDDRRLPDGSRWVDAVALARVCRHVARERGFNV